MTADSNNIDIPSKPVSVGSPTLEAKQSSDGVTQLRSLARLINNEVENIIAQYAKAGEEVPTLDRIKPVVFDRTWNEELRNSVKIVEGACAQLSLTVADPSNAVFNVHPKTFFSKSFMLICRAEIVSCMSYSCLATNCMPMSPSLALRDCLSKSCLREQNC